MILSKNQLSLSLKRYMPVLTLFLLGTGLSLMLFIFTNKYEEQQTSHRFEAEAQSAVAAIQREVSSNIEMLFSLKGFFDAVQSVSREEFRVFLTTMLEKNPTIKAFGWIPRLPHVERRVYELAAQSDGLVEFSINERDENGQKIVAGFREEYFPVYYVEPMQSNRPAVGYDLSSNARRLDALNRARDSDEPIATAPLILVHDAAGASNKETAILVFLPVFKNILGLGDSGHQQKLSGFVEGVYVIDSIVAQAYQNFSEGVEINIIDITDVSNPESIYSNSAASQNIVLLNTSDDLVHQHTIDVAHRQWLIVVTAKEGFFETNSWKATWAVFIAAMSVTCFISLYLLLLIRSKAQVQSEVQRQTHTIVVNEAKTRAIIDNAAEGHFTTTSTGTIESYNRACEAIFGYTTTVALTKNISQLLSNSDIKLADVQASAFEFNESILEFGNREVFGMREDQSVFSAELSISEVVLPDQVIYSGIVRDISERKKVESALVQANHELEEFTYRTSHDLRSPLVSSIALLDVMDEALQEEDNETAQECLGHVQTSLKKLEALVKDILMLTHAKNADEGLEAADFSSIVSSTLENFSHMENFDDVNIQLCLNYTDYFLTRKSRLVNIVENLISNAIKYQDTLKPDSYIRLSSFKEGALIIFEVRDNGLGIPTEQQGKLFTMFNRFHPKTSFGSGLGLYLIKESARVLNGSINYEDTGDGSIFRLEIPVLNKS